MALILAVHGCFLSRGVTMTMVLMGVAAVVVVVAASGVLELAFVDPAEVK